ncbi:hypothetical protein WBJ53_17920 [Spirosoma sp. SC4-14]|uniref:hypothetical protein n=1 Tax=Spirosoma sp. SC4-14 TaxID=3128900 RepID=UPI0030D0CD99
MATVLVLTQDIEQLNAQLGPTLQQIYSQLTLKIRQIDSGLLADLTSGAPPLMILIDSCVESLAVLKELKAHPGLCRIPVLMLRAVATLQKACIEQGTESKHPASFVFPQRRTVHDLVIKSAKLPGSNPLLQLLN